MLPDYLPILLQVVVDPNTFLHYLLLGYGAMWGVALLYVISLHSRQRNMQQDIKLMKQLLAEQSDTDRN